MRPVLRTGILLPDPPLDLSGNALLLVSGVWTGNLTWTLPTTPDWAPLIDQTIQRSVDQTNWTTVATVGPTVAFYNDSPLTQGTTYYYRIRGRNSEGDGEWSSVVSVLPVTTPSSPPGVLVTQGGDQSTYLAWALPLDSGGTAITNYVVQFQRQTAPVGAWTTAGTPTIRNFTVTGLTNGIRYHFRVAAQNAVGIGPYLQTLNQVSVGTPTTAPTNFTASSANQQVVLNWGPPTNNGGWPVQSYEIEQSTDGVNWALAASPASADVTATISGLTNGVAYSYRMRSLNHIGYSQYTAVQTATPAAVPGAIATSSIVLTPGNGQIGVSWSPPSSDGGSAITGYVVDYRTVGGTDYTQSFSGNALTHTITGLTNGTAYEVRVRAFNTLGVGPQPSPSIPQSTPFTFPGAPTGLSGTSGDTQVTLSWTAPASTGGSAITDYAIQFSSNGGSTWSPFTDGTSTATVAAVTSLTNGTAYVFRVAAINAAGQGAWSAASAAVTPAAPLSAPQNFAASTGDGFITLTWSPPANSGAHAITGYRIEPLAPGPTGSELIQETGPNASTVTITQLTNGTAYYFRIRAFTATYDGSWSSTVTETPYGLPGAPTTLMAVRGNAEVTLSWSAPSDNGRPITAYRVQWSTDNFTTVTPVDLGNVTTTVITGLTNGTEHQFRVLATNLAGNGPYSTAVTAIPATVPTAPQNFTATPGDTSTLLQWQHPTSNGGTAITRYRLERSTDGVTFTEQYVNQIFSTTTSINATALTNGQNYWWRLAARNAVGTGPFTPVVQAIPRTTPPVPSGVTGTSGNTQISLTWSQPFNNSGAAITDYAIQFSSNSGSTWTTFNDAVSTATSATVTGLTNGTSYIFRVASINIAGQSAWSDSSPAVFSGAAGALSSLVAYGNDGEVLLEWSAPTVGAPFSNVTIEQSADGSTGWSTIATPDMSDLQYAVTGLTNGVTYYFRVRANNAFSSGPFTNVSGVPATVPGAPTVMTATAGDAQVSLTWTAPANGGSAITDYGIQFSSNSGSTWSTFTDGVSTATSATVTGLTNGTAYVFRVRAVNAKGDGPYSSATSAVTPVGNQVSVQYLVIGGGGGGGGGRAAGGGAGGYRTNRPGDTSGGNSAAEAALLLNRSVAYTVTVGAGGAGGAAGARGASGSQSVFATITAAGGGGGGGNPSNTTGLAGGSGGGGGGVWNNNASPATSFGGVGGLGTSGQGFAGGNGAGAAGATWGSAGGGGGGAGSVGGAATGSKNAGNGGAGLASTITGTSISRGGGGGGGAEGTGSPATGGTASAGGGQGSSGASGQLAAAGAANTGGGGGGGGGAVDTSGQAGGSGVVILRFASTISAVPSAGLTFTNTTVGGDTVLVFTAGTGTVTFP